MTKPQHRRTHAKTQHPAVPGPNVLEKYAPHIVLMLTVVGILIRIYRLDYLSLWVDEYVHTTRAEGVLQGKPLFTEDNNGIFLTLAVILSYVVFGVSDFAARLPSAIFGALVIPATYHAANILFKNKSIGVLSAILATVSLYSVFWSRLCRNYASFEFFYLILAIVFFCALESGRNGERTSNSWFVRNNIDPRYLVLLPVTFVLALANHQLAFFFVFSLMTYVSLIAVVKIIRNEANRFSNKYALLLYPSVAVLILFYTPFVMDMMRPVLRLFLPEFVVTWVIPQWDQIVKKWSSPEAFSVLTMYFQVLKNDLSNYWYLGFLGFPLAFLKGIRGGVFLLTFFVVPWLLMSFVFTDPATSRYLLYIYPFFLMSVAIGAYWVLRLFERTLLPLIYGRNAMAGTIVPVAGAVLLLVFAPLADTVSLLQTKAHGSVIKGELSNWYFSNWREACAYVAPQLKPDDKIVSTMPAGTDRYLKRENSIWFRQMHFDSKTKKYVPNEPSNKRGESAWNYDEFLETVQAARRGWVIVDYYFYNVMTDQRARTYVIENMKYHFNASSDGTVQVFSWDHDAAEPKKAIVLEIGKSSDASAPLTINVPPLDNAAGARVSLDCEAIDADQEAFVVVNRVHSLFLPKCPTPGRQTVSFQVDAGWFRPGANTIQFGYNTQASGDTPRGYAVYNVAVLPGGLPKP